MMNYLKYLLLITFLSFSFAQTNISGTISSNTTWNVSGSPYTITANTAIMDDVTLIVDAGVTVLFSQDVYLRVLSGGTLISQGTETDSIYFTVTDTNIVTNTYGIEFASGAVGSNVQNDTTYISGSVFDYCVFEHFSTDGDGGVLSFENVSFLVKNSLFKDNSAVNGGVIYSISCNNDHYIVNCVFINNSASNGGVIKVGGSGGWSCGGTYIYHNSLFKHNNAGTGGVICGSTSGNYSNSGEHQIYNCNFIENISSGNGGVFYANSIGGGGFTATDSYFYQNTSNQGGVYYAHWGQNLFSFYNSTFVNNGSLESGGVCYWYEDDNSRNFIIDNCNFINNYSINGTSVIKMIEGRTGGNKVLSGSNNYFFGNKSYSDNIDGALISNNDPNNGINLSSSYFFGNGNDTTFINNTLIFGQFVGSNNAFVNNNTTYYLKLLSGGTTTIDMENNYWGTKSSTVIDSLIYDFNDDPNFNTYLANYNPFLFAPDDIMVGSPSSITEISLKTDSTYLTSITENLDPGDNIYIELTGIDTDTLSRGLAVVLVINTMSQDTLVKTLVESSETSGLFRGEVYTSTNTDNMNDIIQGQDGQVLKVISRMNPNQQTTVIIGDTPIPILSNFTLTDETDLMHTLNHTPAFTWSYYDPLSTTQVSYQIQISSDENFSSIDIWDSNVVSSVDTSAIYDGDVLIDGMTYYARVMVVNANSIPSNYAEVSFRMNSVPTAPLMISPINDQVTENPVILNVLNSSDAEEDEITYAFNIYDDVSLTNKIDSVIFFNEGIDSTSWQVNIDLPDNGQYFWNASTNDGFEESVLSELGSFLLNTDNNPPNVFSLSISMVNTSVQSLSPLFSWHPSIDPDPIDTISYTLLLDTPNPGIEVYQIGTDTSFLFPTQLIDNTQYFWQVIASDLLGFETVNEGGYQSFFINIDNDPPTISTLVAPLQGSIQTDIRPNFYWSEAMDPDPLDQVSYSIEWWPVNETDVMFIEDVDTNTFTPEFDLSDNAKFGWRVTAKDIEGLSSMTDSSYFFTDAFPEPPLAFSTVYPENNAEGLGTSIDFVWNKSADPDPLDEVSYQLVYGTDWQDSSTYVFSDITTDTSISVLLDDNIQYSWIVVARDADGFIVGSNNDTPNMLTVGTLSVDDNTVPTVYALHQNYPNPFNPTTKISYDLPDASVVSLSIYDLMGREIRTLINSEQNAGFKIIQWNATDNLGKSVPAGMYIYTIQAGEFRQTRKMVLLK
jgi:hypothetical protein